jgi:cephalosporin-C deacetylase
VTVSPYGEQPAAPTYNDAESEATFAALVDFDEPADFDAFWKQTLDDARAVPADIISMPYQAPLRTLDIADVSFPGFAGQPVRGWLITPRTAKGPLPLLLQYVGYGSGRGSALEHLVWGSCGYAHFVMDTRGQGADTPDQLPSNDSCARGADGPHVTRGIAEPRDYYYRRLITDAVRAAECLPLHPVVDARRVIVAGASQGGALALAAAALSDSPAALLCDVPFMTSWRHAAHVADRGPYADIAAFCRSGALHPDIVFNTLAYFDGRSFATRAQIPALFSVASMDRVCPPVTVRATYHRYTGAKQLRVYEFNDHEGGRLAHTQEQLAFLREHLESPNDQAR